MKVSDSGPGVPTHLKDRIFDAYFTTKDVGEGSGLGLSLSALMARANGCKLSYSREGDVTCFNINIPINSQIKDHLES